LSPGVSPPTTPAFGRQTARGCGGLALFFLVLSFFFKRGPASRSRDLAAGIHQFGGEHSSGTARGYPSQDSTCKTSALFGGRGNPPGSFQRNIDDSGGDRCLRWRHRPRLGRTYLRHPVARERRSSSEAATSLTGDTAHIAATVIDGSNLLKPGQRLGPSTSSMVKIRPRSSPVYVRGSGHRVSFVDSVSRRHRHGCSHLLESRWGGRPDRSVRRAPGENIIRRNRVVGPTASGGGLSRLGEGS